MFHKQTVMNSARTLQAFALIVSVATAWTVMPADAQKLRLNKGCPKLGSSDIGSYTIDELNELCHGGGASQGGPAEGGASLSCGQHKALAVYSRLNSNFVEGQAAQAVVDKYCDNVSDDSLPVGSQVGGDQLSGPVRFERGYYTEYSGAKARICKTYYSGSAYLYNGTIEFVSGGHTWRGAITQNSFISITRDGVDPRPKNPTGISGPMLGAELYNGYCGRGFFRLVLQ
ncbi:hypothetical protein [Nitratireductor sp. XY-223]|uniref:hypothetical protein n=1 Tax=Nitratireductor sp. XY-223 TaxID=2561926 RepID=UPI0010AA00A2|nr:hypothetical protein [Nitratireductor sp. XY-223]